MCISFRDTLATLCLETVPASLKVIDDNNNGHFFTLGEKQRNLNYFL